MAPKDIDFKDRSGDVVRLVFVGILSGFSQLSRTFRFLPLRIPLSRSKPALGEVDVEARGCADSNSAAAWTSPSARTSASRRASCEGIGSFKRLASIASSVSVSSDAIIAV